MVIPTSPLQSRLYLFNSSGVPVVIDVGRDLALETANPNLHAAAIRGDRGLEIEAPVPVVSKSVVLTGVEVVEVAEDKQVEECIQEVVEVVQVVRVDKHHHRVEQQGV